MWVFYKHSQDFRAGVVSYQYRHVFQDNLLVFTRKTKYVLYGDDPGNLRKESKMGKIDYERKDYKRLAKEFGGLRIGKWLIQFLPRDPLGKPYKLFQIVPLDGWITDSKEVERIIRERGLEL